MGLRTSISPGHELNNSSNSSFPLDHPEGLNDSAYGTSIEEKKETLKRWQRVKGRGGNIRLEK